MKHLLFVILLSTLLSGCWYGTRATRFDGIHSPAGAYPYSGVVADVKMIMEAGPHNSCPIPPILPIGLGVISIPLDLVFDTIGLPFDLIGWPFGFKKNNQ